MIPIILIAAATVLIVGIAVVLVKSVVTPKRADAVRRLIKQGKNQAAAKLAKQLIAKKQKTILLIIIWKSLSCRQARRAGAH